MNKKGKRKNWKEFYNNYNNNYEEYCHKEGIGYLDMNSFKNILKKFKKVNINWYILKYTSIITTMLISFFIYINLINLNIGEFVILGLMVILFIIINFTNSYKIKRIRKETIKINHKYMLLVETSIEKKERERKLKLNNILKEKEL